MTNSIAEIGLKGVKAGLAKASEHANNIAANSSSSADTVGDAIGLKLSKHQVEASSKVIKVAEGLDRAVLDILA